MNRRSANEGGLDNSGEVPSLGKMVCHELGLCFGVNVVITEATEMEEERVKG